MDSRRIIRGPRQTPYRRVSISATIARAAPTGIFSFQNWPANDDIVDAGTHGLGGSHHAQLIVPVRCRGFLYRE